MQADELTTRLWIEEHPYSAETQAVVSPLYASKKCSLSPILVQSIQSFLKKNKISWTILIHAAWGLLLNRLSTSDQLIFGTSVAFVNNKSIKQVKPLSPIKSALTSRLTIKQFFKNIKIQLNKKTASDILIQQVKYLLLIKTNKIAKSNTLNSDIFPLVLLVEANLTARFSIYYHHHTFTTSSIENITDHLQVLLCEITADFNQKVCQINILNENEKHLLLAQWSCPKRQSTIPLLSLCTHKSFIKQATLKPKHIAVKYEDINVTYQDLNIASTRLAQLLLKRGTKQNDRICTLMDRTPTLIIVMLAIFKVGAVFVPINSKYPKERIEYVLDDSQAKYIIVNPNNILSDKYTSKLLPISADYESLSLTDTDTFTLPPANPEQIAYIIYTSGTTGNPKGVMIKHKSLINLTDWYRINFNISQQDVASQFASSGFDTFFCETIPFLATGGCICIIDDNTKLTPSLFFPWLKKQKITICDLPTAYAQILLNMPWPHLPHLRTVKIGGESITHYPNQPFSFDLWNSYGPTETTIEATYVKIYDPHVVFPQNKPHQPPIGKPIINSEMYVVDKHLQPVPIGIAGELLIGGECLSIGYLNRDDLTKEKFIDHPFDKYSQTKLYRTGDLVRWLADGNLEFIGRIDYQVKIRGFRIEPSEIEAAISLHPDVSEVIVLAKEDINGEKSLIAYVTPNLDKERYLYQERCLLSLGNDKFIETITEDISKGGVALSGINESIFPGQLARVHFKLPGLTEAKTFNGHIIWQQDNRCGVVFDLNNDEKSIIEKSIDYYLSTHNVMEMVLSVSAKRNLRKALRKKLPEYMIPSAFVTLIEFPFTFSGKIDTKALPPPQEFEKYFQKKFIAPRTHTEKKLAAIWSKLLKQANISMSDDFFDLGATSLTASELSSIVLNQFHISIPTQILFDLPYIPVLAEYINSKGKKYITRTAIQDDIQRDAKLQDNILPSKQLTPNLTHPENIILTGAGGFLGIYLLRELLMNTHAKIHCIIRKGEFETAAKRLVATINKFHLQNEISLSNRRIIVIAGDISFDNFGLPLEHYNHLVEKIDLIYHCGAQVNIMNAYHKLRGSNVQGTIEIIKFACKKINKPIHYISTLSAAYLKNSAGHLIEESPSEQYENLFGGYAISKWISERLLTQVKDRGLPIAIYRSGYIAGQSNTGITNLNDALFMLIKGCIQMRYAPDLDEKITLLPVDFVSKAVIQISLTYPDQSAVYHLDHPNGILWKNLIAWLNDYGYKITILQLKQWQNRLLKISHDNALYPFLPYYLSLHDKQLSPPIDISKTQSVLTQLNLPHPPIDHTLLSIYFDYFRKVNFLPSPNIKVISSD